MLERGKLDLAIHKTSQVRIAHAVGYSAPTIRPSNVYIWSYCIYEQFRIRTLNSKKKFQIISLKTRVVILPVQ